MIGDSLVEDQGQIEHHFTAHFSNQFSELVKHRPTVEGLHFTHISKHMSSWLTRTFTLQEVEEILNSLAADKAPELDGYPLGVLKKSCSFVNQLSDFRPISLVSSMYYKILAKSLANRFKDSLPE